MSKLSHEPMLEMFIFETAQLIEQLEEIIIKSERTNSYTTTEINEIFRMMHTIKGSSAMMLYNNISVLAHSLEDLFYFIREKSPAAVPFEKLTDLILKGLDFIKTELAIIDDGGISCADANTIIEEIGTFLSELEKTASASEKVIKAENAPSLQNQKYYISSLNVQETSVLKAYKAVVYFDEGCNMENVRAFTVVHNIKELVQDMLYFPSDIIENNKSEEIIRENGFKILFRTEYSLETIRELLLQTIFLRHLELETLDGDEETALFQSAQATVKNEVLNHAEHADHDTDVEAASKNLNQSMISVNIAKLDKLMDLVGEMVIAEAMVIQNPELNGLKLGGFHKAARHLHKITGELQDIVMSIRMVPLTGTFHKMHRIVRDMGRKLGKEVELELVGEDTEVDKNILEHISDPLMHLIRNSIDHGIEAPEDRLCCGKPQTGVITLEAGNAGSEVHITVRDDGRGLNREKILKKAEENGLIKKKAEELSDGEIFNMILLPGFSTRECISEYSGRGVGMDVVTKNLEKVGGTIQIESMEGKGTAMAMKIPLTLAIIDGMNIRVGNSCYTIPTTSIVESFRPGPGETITDPDGNEMIMVRGKCYPILRLHRHFGVQTGITEFSEGILIMVSDGNKTQCIFADELLGQQQVVVKALPGYIRRFHALKGLAGCTLLGNGSISLILDIGVLLD